MWASERASWCSAGFSRRQCIEEGLSTDDEVVPCSKVLTDSTCRSSATPEHAVISPRELSLFDLLSSGGEEADSSCGRTSCPRDSLASSAFSDGSEEAFCLDNLPGEPWKVSISLQRASSPSRVDEVMGTSPGLPPPSISTLAAPGLSGERSLVSLGSAAHSTGNCKPCGFFWKAGGCQNGQLCLHCHLCPERAARQRRKARKSEHRAVSEEEATHSVSYRQGKQVERFRRRPDM